MGPNPEDGPTAVAQAFGRQDLAAHPLSPTQVLVVEVLALTGWTAKEIGDFLGMSHLTVRTHISNAALRLRVRGRIGLVIWAYQSGLIRVRR